jgi:hypothetical protein
VEEEFGTGSRGGGSEVVEEEFGTGSRGGGLSPGRGSRRQRKRKRQASWSVVVERRWFRGRRRWGRWGLLV